jgi:hypothetical protein
LAANTPILPQRAASDERDWMARSRAAFRHFFIPRAPYISCARNAIARVRIQ